MEFVGRLSGTEMAWKQALVDSYQQNLLCLKNLPQVGMTN